MHTTRILLITVVAAFSTGCMPVPTAQMAPQPVPQPTPQPIAAPVLPPIPPTPQGVSGVETREPNTCNSQDYDQYLNQPAAVIPTIGLTKKFRVVEYRGLESQDYDPNRVVFRLDAAGNIYNIDCG